MKTSKALVISVGTGTRPGTEAQDSLAHGILYSINNHNPDKIFFIGSKESVEKTLPLVLGEISKEHDIIMVEDPDDINKIYDILSHRFKAIRKQFTSITVDFTSGTKAMTGALTILASLYESNNLSYITGARKDGIVVKGTEKLLTISPYPIIFDKRFAEAAGFFNKYQFDASLEILDQLENTIAHPALLARLSPLKQAALAYSAWDKFDHIKANELLATIKLPQFNDNKAFFGKLHSKAEKEPYYIADIINNARRRAEEGKYDDAVARLYRVIELIGQYRLKGFGIDDTASVPRNKIPAALQGEFHHKKDKIQIGLDMDYRFLAALGDDLGKKFINDSAVKDALKKRNNSVLAHGLGPVNKAAYEKLLAAALEYATATVKNLDVLLDESCFAKWLAGV